MNSTISTWAILAVIFAFMVTQDIQRIANRGATKLNVACLVSSVSMTILFGIMWATS